MSAVDLNKIKISCANCSLSELCLPAGLDRESLRKLENAVNLQHTLRKGETVFSMGDEFTNLYAIRSGCVKLLRTTESGDEQILGFYLPGELLGLDAISQHQHQCSAVALETVSYCSIPYHRLEEICHFVPALQRQMFRLMSRELCNENTMLLSMANKKAESRLASFIVSISERLQSLGYSGRQFTLAMSRQDIANYLGLTIETVSRVIGRMQQQGMLTKQSRQIVIEDQARLRKLCAGS